MRMLTVLLPILLTAVASIFLLLRLPPTMRTTALLLVLLNPPSLQPSSFRVSFRLPRLPRSSSSRRVRQSRNWKGCRNW